MRLINTSTLGLQTFLGEAVPPYAILSHRWNEEELSFQDLEDGKGRTMPGYSKIQRCCAQAQLDGWQYAWIDSCCIDKTSSAELSEAINSMYQWYEDSQVCYAYLSDVLLGEMLNDQLRKSNWFTRGWTLQELLAPSNVVFYDRDWHDIGSKGSLEEIISEITGIDDFIRFETACVAQKMSWAAKRNTTRVEDMAYCLLGLFNVNMPPLYGEGEKAFIRLQLEILKTSDDESIFAWKDEEYLPRTPGGLLASSPSQFKNSGSIRPLRPRDHNQRFFEGHNNPFSMTNKGLYISLLLLPSGLVNGFRAFLKCSTVGEEGEFDCCLAIFLIQRRVNGVVTYSRVYFNTILLVKHDEIEHQLQASTGSAHKYIYVMQEHRRYDRPIPLARGWLFSISAASLKIHGFEISQYDPVGSHCTWSDLTQDEISLSVTKMEGIVAGMMFTNSNTGERILLVVIGEIYGRPWLVVLTPEADKGLEKITEYLHSLYIGTTSRSDYSSDDSVAAVAGFGSSDSGESMKMPMSSSKMRPPVDRMSRQLRNGKSVSASLRHITVEGGGRRCLIDIGISSNGGLRWPAPAWVDTLLVSIGIDDIKLKGQSHRIPKEKRPKKYRRMPSPVVSSQQMDAEKGEKKTEGLEQFNWHRSWERRGDERMMGSGLEHISSREETRGYRRPESQNYRQRHEGKYRRVDGRGYESRRLPRSQGPDGNLERDWRQDNGWSRSIGEWVNSEGLEKDISEPWLK